MVKKLYQYSTTFLDGNDDVRPLIPVILCHGMTGSRTSQSGSCRDMASHGYIVFSLDHHDGSAHFSRTRDGHEQFWDPDQDYLNLEDKKKQL